MNTVTFAAYIAVKEIWRNRGRFFLLSLVIALITLLVLFIAALGEGLANANREYLSKLQAQVIVFREKSDYIIPSSRLEAATLRAVRRVDGVMSAGGIYTSNAEIASTLEPIKVSLLGVETGEPGMPELLSGNQFRDGEVKRGGDRSEPRRSHRPPYRRPDRVAVHPGCRGPVL